MDLVHPVPDFDKPIEALLICHNNILRRMDQLDELAAQLTTEGAPAFAAQVPYWQEILSFMKHSMAHHTRDEEEGLFPILDGRGGEIVERMAFEHRWIEQTEEQMIARFEALASGTHPVTSTAVGELALLARKVTAHYRQHIAQENDELFPLAEKVLATSELRALGDLMRVHRSIDRTSDRVGSIRA